MASLTYYRKREQSGLSKYTRVQTPHIFPRNGLRKVQIAHIFPRNGLRKGTDSTYFSKEDHPRSEISVVISKTREIKLDQVMSPDFTTVCLKSSSRPPATPPYLHTNPIMPDCAPNFEHDPCIATLQPLSRDSSVAHPVQPPSLTRYHQINDCQAL